MKAGITGHQNLGDPETVAWVAGALARVIETHGVQHGFTSLAIGADQMFAEILNEKTIPYTAVIPCREYEKTFQTKEHLENYRRLLQGATKAVSLNFIKPEENAFIAAGECVVDLSDFVIAVWDGLPAKGRGGTEEIVRYARSKEKLVAHINLVIRQVLQT